MEMEHCSCTKWISGVVLLLVTLVMWKIARRIIDMNMLRPVAERKKRLREEGFRALELKYGNVDVAAEKILSLPEDKLIEQLQKRQLTATQVLDAFIAKAFQIQQKHNCITEFIPRAHKWAEELDELKEVKGPLHGVPVSIKDNCDIEHHDSTLGLAKKCFSPKSEHAVIVKVLLDLGAIPFCRTNVPQTLLSIGCSNPIFGTTTNFLNSALTPGGSSGGEGTLIAGGGSILGIGSDIAGSIRMPAHFCGVFGYKPTNHRLSSVGFTASLPNIIGIAGVPGIMTKTIDTLILTTRLLLEENRQRKYDHLTLPIPWNNKPFELKRKLRIGYYTSLPFFPLVGDTEEVVMNAKAALEKDGHTVLPFEMPDSYEMMKLTGSFTFSDLGSHLCKNWKGEVIRGALLPNFVAFSLPLCLKKMVAHLMELPIPFLHSSRAPVFVKGGAAESKELMDRMGERKTMIQNLIKQWKEKELDLLLCPTFPFPAIPNELSNRLQAGIAYTVPWNLFDFPSGVVKFGVESGKNLHHFNHENDFMLRPAVKGVKESIGMPISCQLVGLPYDDEMVLYGMKCLHELSPEPNK